MRQERNRRIKTVEYGIAVATRLDREAPGPGPAAGDVNPFTHTVHA